jgi:hypothetical protein
MNDVSEARWALAVRVLALICAFLAVIATLEARAIRQARREVQALRSERDQATAAVTSGLAQRSREEMSTAIRWLDAFYAEPVEGLGRAGGLCPDGRLDDGAVATFAAEFARARARGESVPVAIESMKAAVVRTDDYQKIHPRSASPETGRR